MGIHIFKGTSAPATAPYGVGHHYIDTVAKKAYMSVGTSTSADWLDITGGGGGGSSAPSVNGGSGSPQSVVAAAGITLVSISFYNYVWVLGSPGAATVSATPSVEAGTADGQELTITGTDATKTVTLQDEGDLAGSGLKLNGSWIGGLGDVLYLFWDNTQSLWVEKSRGVK